MNIPFLKKKEVLKNYNSVLTQFKVAVADMTEIVSRESESIKELQIEREMIDVTIRIKDREIDNCEVAISNIGDMFPGLTPDEDDEDDLTIDA